MNYGNDFSESLKAWTAKAKQVPLLTRAEEISLHARMRRGDASAREQLIRANLLLVIKLAFDFTGRGVPLEDLIAEGNIGLMRGVDRYNPRKGSKLSSWASWWIKARIQHVIANHSSTIRMPVHVFQKLAKIRWASAKLYAELGREPSDEELADLLQIRVPRLQKMKSMRPEICSLHTKSEDSSSKPHDGLSEFGNSLMDHSVKDPATALMAAAGLEELMGAVRSLPERARGIIVSRFGLLGKQRLTLKQVGQRHGLTRERIRQCERSAIRLLRRTLRHADMANFTLQN